MTESLQQVTAEETPDAVSDAERIREAFDATFYRHFVPGLADRTDEALIEHYLRTGWTGGLDPRADFSGALYLEHNPDVAETGMNPFVHYLAYGRDEGRNSCLSRWGKSTGDVVPSSDLDLVMPVFDAAEYRASGGDLQALGDLDDRSLAAHYLVFGWHEGRDPSSDFSTEAYLEANPDVAGSGLNPLLHYLRSGQSEQRAKQTAERQAQEMERHEVAAHFDAEFYRSQNSDVSGRAEKLLIHFMETGWREGRDPAPDFSTSYYLQSNPDVVEAGINPLLHYARVGRSEGRVTRAPETAPPAKAATAPPRVSAADMAAVAPHFDAGFYRATNSDLFGSDEELLQHYMASGWRQLRDPAPNFSTSYYLETYSDISSGGLNPFLHYVLFGKQEGRRPRGDEPMWLQTAPDADIIPQHLASILTRLDPAADGPRPPAKVNPAAMNLHWVMPDFSRGSGGHMTIFRMIRHLEMMGHRCHIWIEAPVFHETGEEAWQDIVKYFQCVRAQVSFVSDGLFETSDDVLIATGWSTAFIVNQAVGFAAKYYFVQDHETEFYPTGTENLMARRTYDFDLACICASPWLDGIMQDRYGRWARHFHLAFDHDTYRLQDPAAHAARLSTERTGPLRIAAYARDHTARRCVYLMLMAMQLLGRKRQDFEVHFFGQEQLPFATTNFPALNHGILDSHQLASLYNDCDIGICFSATNYSLVPQEMMACGLPLLELDTESTRAIFPEDTVTLAGPDPHDIAAALERMLDDPGQRRDQSAAAVDWVNGFSWHDSARKVEAAITEYLGHRALAAPATPRPRETRLDVVIPTWNGLGELKPVIEALRQQRVAEEMQIHCIDSSSNDGTAEWLRQQKDIALTVIPQSEFQHGRTRNEGAAQGSAPVVSFLTQDACPATTDWATDILKMMDHHPEAAGLFGRHKPYPDHPEFVREEIERHFDNMLRFPLALSKDTDPERWRSGDVGWRQLLHFYSDNNSAMRRVVWQDIPYPEVDYGEDQVWARDIIEAGFSKLYAPTATVFHSHDYDPKETYKRSKIEGAFFYTHFGYRLSDGSEEERNSRIEREQTNLRRWARRRDLAPGELEERLANIDAKHRGWRDGREEAESITN